MVKILSSVALFLCFSAQVVFAVEKPKLTIDELFNSVSFDAVRLSPDGHGVVIAIERADWEQKIFRKELWIYRDGENSQGTLAQLTQSGYDSGPQWSPDGQWIAFFSERKSDRTSDDSKEEPISQIYLISPSGGEAFPVTNGAESVHTFCWSPDSRSIYFATRQPWTKDQKATHKNEWKDVLRYRGDERGDGIYQLDVSDAIARHTAEGTKPTDDADDPPDATPGAKEIAQSPLHISGLTVAPDGQRLAFASKSVSEREEKVAEFEIFTADLKDGRKNQVPRQITHNQAVEQHLHWAPDSKHLWFTVQYGSVEGAYKDAQWRLYSVDVDTGVTQRWAADFDGALLQYVGQGDQILAAGRLGTEVQIYSQASATAPFRKESGWNGTYESLAAAPRSPRIAFVHSTLEKPTEVYLADSLEKLEQARAITSFNHLFTERDLPKGKTYRWAADDGTTIEGMLMYPPGKFEAKGLPLLVYIHGGPDDADGNHFEGDWYVWDRLAATQGWLVFEPNYRGSLGYGDRFLSQIVPQIVSRPGKDVLEGVDALIKDGIADPSRLAIGGYSYGGYLTNWLITQSTRWRAAVTGAGAVENVANWGNDDTTFDDAYFLGGRPWEASQRYHDEAAIFQIDKVRTPTLVVAGADDDRVAVAEDFLLEHALHSLGIPSELLIFPGEGHSFERDPWHGKIMVREELRWLEKYGGVGTAP